MLFNAMEIERGKYPTMIKEELKSRLFCRETNIIQGFLDKMNINKIVNAIRPFLTRGHLEESVSDSVQIYV